MVGKKHIHRPEEGARPGKFEELDVWVGIRLWDNEIYDLTTSEDDFYGCVGAVCSLRPMLRKRAGI